MKEKLKIAFFAAYFLLAPYVGYKVAEGIWKSAYISWVESKEKEDGLRMRWQIETFQKLNPDGATLPLPGGRYIVDRTINLKYSKSGYTYFGGRRNDPPVFDGSEIEDALIFKVWPREE